MSSLGRGAAMARGASAIAFGLAIALLGERNVDRLQPLCVGLCLADGLWMARAWIGDRRGGAWAPAAFSLALAGLIGVRPLFSILTYSFLLQVHLAVWLAGTGVATAATAGGWPGRLGGAMAAGAALHLLTYEGAGLIERAPLAGIAVALWGAGLLADGRRARSGA